MRESEKLLQMLLDKGANVNSVDERTNEKKIFFFIFKTFFFFFFFAPEGNTPLHGAISESNNHACIRMLLINNADPTIKNFGIGGVFSYGLTKENYLETRRLYGPRCR